MNELIEKETRMIVNPIKAYIQSVLENNFNTNSRRVIIKVLSIKVDNILVDSETSNFRDHIYINGIDIEAEVYCQFTENSFRKEALKLFATHTILLAYDKIGGQYNVINTNEFDIIELP